MKPVKFVSAIYLLFASAFVSAEALPPATAALHEGETVTVEFKVKGTGWNPAGFDELYSEPTWDHPDAFFIRFPVAVSKEFSERNISVKTYYTGYPIRVTGVVQTLNFGAISRKAIYVNSPQQIERLSAPTGLSAAPGPAGAGYLPTSAYAIRTIQGFTLLINPDALNRKPELDTFYAEVGSQLGFIARSLPPNAVEALRQVKIWVELNNQSEVCKSTVFHKDRNWLIAHRFNPEKASAIEICDIRNMVAWSRQNQPMMLLHELAHAYQFRVVGDQNADILSAFRQAQRDGLYQSVDYSLGGKLRAYATTNEFEYFAELSEAYWGKNDYFPFNRADLMRYDPRGYALMQQVWGS